MSTHIKPISKTEVLLLTCMSDDDNYKFGRCYIHGCFATHKDKAQNPLKCPTEGCNESIEVIDDTIKYVNEHQRKNNAK